MALPLLNSFETVLPDETDLTAVNSGDGSAGNAFDVENIISPSVIKYDNARAAHGNLSARIDHSGANGAYFGWNTSMGAQTQVWGRLYAYRTATPTPDGLWLVQMQDVGDVTNTLVRWNSDGELHIFDSTLGPVGSSDTVLVPVNEWVRIEWFILCSVTVGVVECKLFQADSTSPLVTFGMTNCNTGTQVVSAIIGGTAATTVGSSTWVDDVALNNTGYPGPAGAGGGGGDNTSSSMMTLGVG